MLRNFLIIFLIIVLQPNQGVAQWIPLNNKNEANTPPKVSIISDNDYSTVIKVDISGFNLKEFSTDGEIYQSADLLTDIYASNPGYPELSHIAKTLAIPDRASISVEVLETSETQVFKNIQIPPARESWKEGHPETPYIINAKAYQSSSIFPAEQALIETPSIFRDFRIARISIFPIRYIADKEELHVVSSITVRINYNDSKGETVNPKTSSRKAIAPSFAKLYRSFIFNYESVLDRYYNGDETGREVMLCIMPDEFYDSFLPYAEWKNQSGTNIKITKFSDIGANSNNPVIIKDHITNAYHNWEYPPTYVLLVGDDGVFPIKIVDYDYSFASEDYFVEIDGDDYIPEMMVGRLTNQGDYRMQVMLNKFMKYEKEPYVGDTNWFKKATCCSNNFYPSQIETKRFTTDVMITDGGFTSVDTLMSDSGCSMNLDDILNTINDGRSFLNYRGEGWSDGWWANCYPFGTSAVSTINNGEKFTFVTSIGCGVAMFNDYGGNCFGEEWVQLGSLSDPRGGIGFIGPTSNTHTTYNNRIDKGIYVGMFREGMDTPGEALLRGKLYMYNVFGAENSWVEYHYRVFCLLGDPSIHIWKDVPREVVVNHTTSVPVGYSQPEFTVTFASTGLPVKNAQVCLSGDDVYASGTTDSTGVVSVGINPESEDILNVTVRGGNVIPYQGTIEVLQMPEHVGPIEDPIIIDIDGYVNGYISPNENCNITFTLKNWGSQTSNNVQATLSASEYVEIITTSPVSFGNLEPGGSFTGDPFQFYVMPNCPLDEEITLELHVTSSTSAWDYSYYEEILGCELLHNNSIIDDEGSLIRNFRMDPGETVKVYFSIINSGVDLAPNVMGVLRSNDQYITIDDSTGSFGTLDTGYIATNSINHFVVTIDPTCPTEYFPEYSLMLYTQDGNYPYETVCNFTIPVAVPIPQDFTGPDAYGYYAYSSEDSIYEQAPEYNWVELNQIGTQLDVPFTSEYTQTVGIPFQFKYYGLFFDNIRISTDGWMAFGSGSQTAFTNRSLPKNDEINCMTAIFWDDLFTESNDGGKIYYHNDIDNHRFIIEWDSVAHWSSDLVRETFQAVLYDPLYYNTPTGDGEIIFQYKKVSRAESSTIGIENHSQDIGLQYVYNNNYDATASRISSGIALKFTTDPPFITVSIDENDSGDSKYSALLQNYPNPFSHQTRIDYTVNKQSDVKLNIYDLNGKLIRTLLKGQKTKGKYSVVWNGTDEYGNHVNSGIYLYQLQTDGVIEMRKLLLIK